jgi:hypothetical protein
MLTQRQLIQCSAAAALGAAIPRTWAADEINRLIPDYELPMFNLPGQIKQPLRIESIEVLKRGSNCFMRTRSTDGAVGLSLSNRSSRLFRWPARKSWRRFRRNHFRARL